MFFRDMQMKKFILPFGFLAVALAMVVQPTLMASAAELFVRQNDEKSDSQGISGKPALFNTLNSPESSGKKKMPFQSQTRKFVSNTSKQKKSMKVPGAWKGLSDEIIQNRVGDTKNALALSAKIEKKVAAQQAAYDNFNGKTALERKHEEFLKKYINKGDTSSVKKTAKKSYGHRKVSEKESISTRKVFNTPSND